MDDKIYHLTVMRCDVGYIGYIGYIGYLIYIGYFGTWPDVLLHQVSLFVDPCSVFPDPVPSVVKEVRSGGGWFRCRDRNRGFAKGIH